MSTQLPHSERQTEFRRKIYSRSIRMIFISTLSQHFLISLSTSINRWIWQLEERYLPIWWVMWWNGTRRWRNSHFLNNKFQGIKRGYINSSELICLNLLAISDKNHKRTYTTGTNAKDNWKRSNLVQSNPSLVGPNILKLKLSKFILVTMAISLSDFTW